MYDDEVERKKNGEVLVSIYVFEYTSGDYRAYPREKIAPRARGHVSPMPNKGCPRRSDRYIHVSTRCCIIALAVVHRSHDGH